MNPSPSPSPLPPISPLNPLTGHCFCKALTLEITAPPLSSYLCHCQNCRVSTGSSFAHQAGFPAEAVRVGVPRGSRSGEGEVLAQGTAGIKNSTTQQTNSKGSATGSSATDGPHPQTLDKLLTIFSSQDDGSIQFCRTCATRLVITCPDRIEAMRGVVLVPVGVISGSESDERLRPSVEGFVKRRERWMGKMDGTEEKGEW